MKPVSFFLILCALSPLFFGCSSLRNEVNPGQLGLESSKLVVTCFLSPQDTVLAVKVTRSATVVGDSVSLLQTGNNVPDATVTLTDGDRTLVLPYNSSPSGNPNQLYYKASTRFFPILASRTYTLTVTTPNGQRARSTCTIPRPVAPSVLSFDSLMDNQGRNQVRRYFIRSLWQDPPEQTNYYQITGNFRYTTRCSTCQADQSGNVPLSFQDDNRDLLSDSGVDGTLMLSGRGYMTSSSSTGGQQTGFYDQYKTASVTVNLLSLEQTLYRYQEAIIRQRRSRNNPFAEPVPIPGNIEGGLGCFAGYNSASLTVMLK
ncbi:DUF4249 domain-containing protein [Spirosoma areae]